MRKLALFLCPGCEKVYIGGWAQVGVDAFDFEEEPTCSECGWKPMEESREDQT